VITARLTQESSNRESAAKEKGRVKMGPTILLVPPRGQRNARDKGTTTAKKRESDKQICRGHKNPSTLAGYWSKDKKSRKKATALWARKVENVKG